MPCSFTSPVSTLCPPLSVHPLLFAQVFPRLCPDGIDLLQRMFEYDPAKRITVCGTGPWVACSGASQLLVAGRSTVCLHRRRSHPAVSGPTPAPMPCPLLLAGQGRDAAPLLQRLPGAGHW